MLVARSMLILHTTE